MRSSPYQDRWPSQPQSERTMSIRVVYLIGAGATQAEIDHRGGEKINLLMQDNPVGVAGLATRIIARAKRYNRLNTAATAASTTDAEKLISLRVSVSSILAERGPPKALSPQPSSHPAIVQTHSFPRGSPPPSSRLPSALPPR